MPKALGGFLGGEPGLVHFSGLFRYYCLVPVPVWGPAGGPQGSLGEIHGGDPLGGIPRGSPKVLGRFWLDSGSILLRILPSELLPKQIYSKLY